MTSARRIDKVCEECGGDVSFEGWISWSIEAQEFVVDDICDKGHHCRTCDGTTHSVDKVLPAFEVQHYTLCDGWINCWSVIDEQHMGPQQFESEEAAQKAIDEHFDDLADAEMEYSRDEFRIQPVEEPDNGS
jgi:hypothetical protein